MIVNIITLLTYLVLAAVAGWDREDQHKSYREKNFNSTHEYYWSSKRRKVTVSRHS